MKLAILHALVVPAVAMLALATNSTHAQTTGTGPYYATPSWDQQLPASTRFVILSNWVDTNFPSGGAAVLDRETGLVWERSPTGSDTWLFSRSVCPNRMTGGRRAWRLPSVHELASLVDPSVSGLGPKVPAGNPFQNVQAAPYWSATTDSLNAHNNTTNAWAVNIGTGSPFFTDESNGFNIWCVRGGMNADQY
jgi:hypothetical protein